MSRKAFLVIGILIVCAGCAASPDGRGIPVVSSESYDAYRREVDSWGWGDYFLISCKDLVLDFTDILSAEISTGPGFLINVQPTKLLNIGLGYGDMTKAGWRKRALGVYREDTREGGLSALYFRQKRLEPIYGTPDLFIRRYRGMSDFTIRHNTDRHWLDIGAEVHIIGIGGSAYLSPFEAFDFGVNLVFFPYNVLIRPLGNTMGFRPPEIDVANDDTMARVREKYGLTVVRVEEGFPPTEMVDGLFRLAY